MIEHQDKFESYIISKGVGSNDKVSDSVKSYISYLHSVSLPLDISISSKILSTKNDVIYLSKCLFETGKVSEKQLQIIGQP